MCGITGSVGKPNNSLIAYNLHTNLLRETKRRGKHATGFYAVGMDRKPIFDKAPISADAYVKKPAWKQLINGNIAMIGHARFTTNGAAHINGNNHPHVSKSGNMALVHNGIIYNYEELKNDYSNVLESECDSEIILRIIAKEKDPIRGIKKTYELLGSGGDFACELIHVNPSNGKTMFYFFRDNGRPGIMIDAREILGQLIFCSEASIWKDAVNKSGMSREIRQLATYEIPEYKILSIDADTLKVKETEVKKPKIKKIKSSKFSISNYNNDYYYRKNNFDRNIYSKAEINYGYGYVEPSFKNEVPKDWIETIDQDSGLKKYVYDKNDKYLIDPEDQDFQFKELLESCLDNEHERYPGWQDDAYSYGIISEEKWLEISDQEISNSEDILDYIEDLDMSDQISDNEFLYELSQKYN